MTSFDPIYSLSPEKIVERSEPDLESVYRAIGSVPTYHRGYYKSPDYMRELRKRASMMFLSDYETHPERYLTGELPRLPFADCKFDLTLVSYFLFRVSRSAGLRVPPRIDSSNHACDARRGAHLSDSHLRSATQRVRPDAAIRSGTQRLSVHRNQN